MALTEDQVNMSGRPGEYGEQLKEIRSLWRFLQGRANPAILCLAHVSLQSGFFRRRAPGTDTNVSNKENEGRARSPPRELQQTLKPWMHSDSFGFKFKGKGEGAMRQPWRGSPSLVHLSSLWSFNEVFVCSATVYSKWGVFVNVMCTARDNLNIVMTYILVSFFSPHSTKCCSQSTDYFILIQ